jgi:hypothetical protein
LIKISFEDLSILIKVKKDSSEVGCGNHLVRKTNRFQIFGCGYNNIKHVLNATKTPKANGQNQIERYFGTVLTSLRAMVENDREWDENLVKMQWCLNTTVNSTMNVTLQQLLFTYTPNDAASNLLTTKPRRNRNDECGDWSYQEGATATRGSFWRKAPKTNGLSGKRSGTTALW